jgi:hypothetical protein
MTLSSSAAPAPRGIEKFTTKCEQAGPNARRLPTRSGLFCRTLFFAGRRACTNALVAQLDRASDFDSEGREFESLRARQISSRRASAMHNRTFFARLPYLKDTREDCIQMALFGNLTIPSDILNHMEKGGRLYRQSDDQIDLKLTDGVTMPVDPDMFRFLLDERRIASATGEPFGFYRLK